MVYKILLERLCNEAGKLGFGLQAVEGRKALASGSGIAIYRACFSLRAALGNRIDKETLAIFRDTWGDINA